jgi:hypothetical protein
VIDRLTGIELSRKATQAYLDRADESVEFVRATDSKEVIEFSAEEQARMLEALSPIYAVLGRCDGGAGDRRARHAGRGRRRID